MAELVNLRQVRKRAERKKREHVAEHKRLAHGEPKHMRERRDAEARKAARGLDAHRIGDDE